MFYYGGFSMKKCSTKLMSLIIIFLLLLNTMIDISGVQLSGQKAFAATPSWTSVASLPTTLNAHKQSALSDGSVIVTGGHTGSSTSSMVYLYNPDTNQWTAKASLPLGVYDHSQSTLNDGRVLVCGGYYGGAIPNSFIYNPSSNTWTNASNMPEGIRLHAQSTLNNGKVLITGGWGTNSGYSGKSYIYDPSSNLWSTVASIPKPLYYHNQSTLLDGRVLVVGGYDYNTGYYSNAAYIYNPISNTWSVAASLPITLGGHAQNTLPDGKVLVTGGFKQSTTLSSETYLYDPSTNTWSNYTPLPEGSAYHAQSILSKGRVLITGGYNGSSTKSYSNIIQYNQDPVINITTPVSNTSFSSNDTSLIPQISSSDPDNDSLTIKLFINSETTPRETRSVINTSSPQTVSFNSINIGSFQEGIHTFKFEVSDGKTTVNKSVDVKVDKTGPTFTKVDINSETDKISVLGTATDSLAGLSDNPYLYSIDDNSSNWTSLGQVADTPANIVNLSYDTSGNGGRKLIKLSNGWLVCVAKSSNVVYWYKSVDNGLTWVQLTYATIGSTLGSYTLTSIGTNVYSIMNDASTLYGIKFDATSVPNTERGGTAITVDSSQTSFNGCSIILDGSNLHAVWASKNSTYPNSFNVRYSKSMDNGATWATPTQTTTSNTTGEDYKNPSIIVNALGYPVIFSDINQATTTNLIKAFQYDGTSFYYRNVYINNGFTQTNPCAVVDKTGTIHVVWQGYDSTDTSKYNIRYSKSIDNGATWSSAIKLTQGNTYNQEKPTITTDSSGKVYVYWQGIDPAVSTSYYNIRKTVLDGSTWSSIETITKNTTNSALNPTLCSNFTDFFSPLYIYQDQQAGAVKFSGLVTNPNTPFEITGLLPNTPHLVTFKAKDKVDNISTYSQTVYTKAVQPTLIQTEASDTSIILAVNDSNPQDTQYQISCGERYVNALGEITTQATWTKIPNKSITVTGMDNRINYTFSIKARNGNGVETMTSDAVSATTGLSKPAIPQNITAQPKSNSITLVWDDVLGAISYDIEADGNIINVPNNLYYSHTGLSSGTAHVYRVRARNAEAVGDWSEEIVVETLNSAPAKVNNLTAQKSSTTVRLQWDEILGGGVVYQLEADGKLIDTGFENTYLHQNLPVNSRHTYRVRAVNSIGTGPWANAITVTTQFTAPMMPTNIKGVGSKVKIVVTWDKVPDTTNYIIDLKCNDPNLNGSQLDNKNNTYRVIYGSPDSTYYLRIKAKNAAGESAWSEQISVKTYALETPEFADIVESQQEVNLKWGAVPDAKTYEIERNGEVVGTTSELQFKDTGLSVETKYSYRIKAISETNKESNWSYTAEAITLPEKPPVPSDFYASGANGMVSLSWSPVPGAIAYDLEIDGVIIENGANTEYLYKDVAPKTEHFYRVRARNSGIEGDWHLGIKLVTLPDAMQAPSNIDVSTTNTVTTIKWEKVPDAVRYEVEVDGLVVYNGTRNEYVHRRLDPNTEHVYRLRSIGFVDTSAWSSQIVNNAVTLVCDKGKNAQIGLSASDVTDFSGYTLTVIYNKDVLEVNDLCTLTTTKELTIGKIKGTDVEVIQFEPGKIVFKVDKPIEIGKTWSGIINRIGFNGRVTGGTTITYTVFITPKIDE